MKMSSKKGGSSQGGKLLILVVLFLIAVGSGFAVPGEMGAAVRRSIAETFRIFKDGSGAFGLPVLVSCAAAVLFVAILSTILKMAANATVRDAHSQTVAELICAVITYLSWIAGIVWVLILLGVNVAGVFAGLGIISLILGFAAESLIEDVITGFFIIFEHQYDVGDIIVLDDFRGVVEKIGVRTTTIRDDGNNLKVVNNSDIRNFQNRSRKESVAVAIIGITYGQDVEEFERIVKENLPDVKAKYPEVFTGPIIYKGIEELADSSVNVKFTADCTEAQIFNAKRLLNREIKIMFDKNGIEIPFPQLDVHNIP